VCTVTARLLWPDCYGPIGSDRKRKVVPASGLTEEEIELRELEYKHSFGKDTITFIKVRGDGCRNVRDGSRSFRGLRGMVCGEFKEIRIR
jgi:hypothetical protein